VTELVNGPTLAQRLRSQPLTQSQVAGMGAVLCDALAYMHRQGIVHRDVKPANILLASEAADGVLHPKLSDFGLAYMVDSTRMTGVGLTAGTPNYLSPEQVRGLATTPASDIYALGLVLIEASTGTPAFAGHGIEAALARLSRDPCPPPNVDRRLAELLVAMTDAEPGNRPSAAETRTQLDALAGGSLISQLVAIAPEQTVLAPSARWRPFGLATAGLAMMSVGAAAAVVIAAESYLHGSNRTPAPPADAAIIAPNASESAVVTSPATSVNSPSDIGFTTVRPPVVGPTATTPTPTARVVRGTGQTGGKGHGKKGNNK
jgi:serine/threonine protein kinase